MTQIIGIGLSIAAVALFFELFREAPTVGVDGGGGRGRAAATKRFRFISKIGGAISVISGLIQIHEFIVK